MSFVRFVVGADAENAAWLTGVFTEARILQDEGEALRPRGRVIGRDSRLVQ